MNQHIYEDIIIRLKNLKGIDNLNDLDHLITEKLIELDHKIKEITESYTYCDGSLCVIGENGSIIIYTNVCKRLMYKKCFKCEKNFCLYHLDIDVHRCGM